MRFSLAVAVVALVSSASAGLFPRQDGLPACAASCLTNADFGGCQPTDNNCLCKNEKFINSTTTCIGANCTGPDLENAINAAKQLCLIVGVTLTSTPAGFPSGTAAPAASSGASGTNGTNGANGTSGSNGASGTSGASAPASTGAASVNGLSYVAGLAAIGMAALAL